MGRGREQVSQNRMLCNSINPNRCTGQMRGLDGFRRMKKECTQLEIETEKNCITNKVLCQRPFIPHSSVRFLRTVLNWHCCGDLNTARKERLGLGCQAENKEILIPSVLIYLCMYLFIYLYVKFRYHPSRSQRNLIYVF